MIQVLIIDNNDSFTYNLMEMLRQTGLCKPSVCLLENIQQENLEKFDAFVLSPGPGLPAEKPGLFDLIDSLKGKKPILGVCLGHQAIAQFFGAALFQLSTIVHGEASEVNIKPEAKLFKDLPRHIEVGRYHSWAIENKNLPGCFEVSAATTTGIIMGLSHRLYNMQAVQFHPESILTPTGAQILANWLTYCVA